MPSIAKILASIPNILTLIIFAWSTKMEKIIELFNTNTALSIFFTFLIFNFVFTFLYIASTQTKIKNLKSVISVFEKNLKNEIKDFRECFFNDPLSIDYNSPYFFLLLHDVGYSDGEINEIIKRYNQKKEKLILKKLDKIVKRLKE